ncbi:MAG: glycoside hydrolase family 3 N-terminal domain-containing protein, partial [Anaerolineae bacterium]|nr:glycoside hydrolase family 3 N-terminal domain-containing protein [Anaerolineae bacterium]
MINLKTKPFYLSDEDIRWVEETKAGMSLKDKVGQLFCLIFMGDDAAGFYQGLQNAGIKPCGFMARPMDGAIAQKATRELQAMAEIPLFIAANLESGGSGVASSGTNYANPMQIAATDDEEYAYKLGQICGTEGRAVGVNWSFAPIIDIDYNFANPITNTRTYGSDPERVLRMGSAYMKGIKESNLAVSIKHWPGDGVDGRDQHLLASVNTLSTEEWDATYGKIYSTLIEEGARTVMSAHIMLPEYSRKLRPGIKDEDILPASLAYELNNDLLRGKLGFNGLIVSDATPMAGYIASLPH